MLYILQEESKELKMSLFGWLENIPWWRDLSYPAKGALLRAFKAALSVIVSAVLTLVTAGLLFPATMNPTTIVFLTALLTSILQGLDKYLRESALEKEMLGDSNTSNVGVDVQVDVAVTDNPPDGT
jgi:hypothetical protein